MLHDAHMHPEHTVPLSTTAYDAHKRLWYTTGMTRGVLVPALGAAAVLLLAAAGFASAALHADYAISVEVTGTSATVSPRKQSATLALKGLLACTCVHPTSGILRVSNLQVCPPVDLPCLRSSPAQVEFISGPLRDKKSGGCSPGKSGRQPQHMQTLKRAGECHESCWTMGRAAMSGRVPTRRLAMHLTRTVMRHPTACWQVICMSFMCPDTHVRAAAHALPDNPMMTPRQGSLVAVGRSDPLVTCLLCCLKRIKCVHLGSCHGDCTSVGGGGGGGSFGWVPCEHTIQYAISSPPKTVLPVAVQE